MHIKSWIILSIWVVIKMRELKRGRMWVWYEGACGAGIPIDTTYNDTTGGQDTSIVVSPSTTTSYYVRAESGICDPSECIGKRSPIDNFQNSNARLQ